MFQSSIPFNFSTCLHIWFNKVVGVSNDLPVIWCVCVCWWLCNFAFYISHFFLDMSVASFFSPFVHECGWQRKSCFSQAGPSNFSCSRSTGCVMKIRNLKGEWKNYQPTWLKREQEYRKINVCKLTYPTMLQRLSNSVWFTENGFLLQLSIKTEWKLPIANVKSRNNLIINYGKITRIMKLYFLYTIQISSSIESQNSKISFQYPKTAANYKHSSWITMKIKIY